MKEWLLSIIQWPIDKLKESAYLKFMEWLDPGAVIIAMACCLFMMLGAKRAGRWLWWTLALYTIIKLIEGAWI